MLESKIETAVLSGELKGLHSVLVIHKGDVIAERYFPGKDERWGTPLDGDRHDATSLHDLRR